MSKILCPFIRDPAITDGDGKICRAFESKLVEIHGMVKNAVGLSVF